MKADLEAILKVIEGKQERWEPPTAWELLSLLHLLTTQLIKLCEAKETGA